MKEKLWKFLFVPNQFTQPAKSFHHPRLFDRDIFSGFNNEHFTNNKNFLHKYEAWSGGE